MQQNTTQNILQILWREQSRNVYAILDGARNENIEPMVRSSNLPHDCLYYEPLTEKLRAAAPYIIELKADSKFTLQLLEQGWGQSWGIFLIAYPPAKMSTLRHNYRKLNIVQGPGGQKLLFRYYDPRVLRTYLPTCTLEEVCSIFGPVKEIIMEGEDEHKLQCFKHNTQGEKLEQYPV